MSHLAFHAPGPSHAVGGNTILIDKSLVMNGTTLKHDIIAPGRLQRLEIGYITKKFIVWNIHNHDLDAYRQQIAHHLDVDINASANAPDSVSFIALGDFNIEQDSEPYKDSELLTAGAALPPCGIATAETLSLCTHHQ